MGRPKSISSSSLFVSSELCYICVVHAQVVKRKQTTTVAMLSSQLGIGRAICISRFSHPEFRSLSSKRLCVLCPLLLLHLLSFFLLFFPSFTCLHLMVTRKKLFVWRENSILLSRVYFTISSRVRHTHIDVVVIKSSSFVMTLFSLILYYIYILSF